MNTKLLAVIFTLTFAISSLGIASAIDWKSIEADSVGTANIGKITVLTLSSEATIPHHTSELAGFAWVYDTNEAGHSAYAVTTHNAKEALELKQNVARDSTQNPDGWHAHNVILGGHAPANSDVCVADLSDAPTAGISFVGNTVLVKAKNSSITGTFAEEDIPARAFSITIDAGCVETVGSVAPLGLIITDTED